MGILNVSSLHDVAHAWEAAVFWVARVTNAPPSLMHVYAGMALFIIGALVTRRSLGSVVPLLIVCFAEMTNETMDRISYGSWQIRDTARDVLNTLFWPFILMMFVRWRNGRQKPTDKGR